MTTKVTPHFTTQELQCRHCGTIAMDQAFLEKLESLRNAFGKPMIVTSAYRCPKHNAAVGEGKLVGAHTLGCAVDVAIAGQDAFTLIKLAFTLGFTGVGIKQHGPANGRYVHLDAVPTGRADIPRPATWTYS